MTAFKGIGFGAAGPKGDTGPTGNTGSTGPQGATGVAGSVSVVSQTQSATGYTLALADQDKFTYATGASMLLNIAAFATVAYPVDAEYHWCGFLGIIGVTYASGVTIISANGYKSATLGSVFTLKNKSTNLWVMFGSTTT